MTHEKRTKLRRQQDLIDTAVSKRGQVTAKRYLAARDQAPTTGNLRAGLAFLLFAAAVIFIGMAL
jgi:hypothetical protein